MNAHGTANVWSYSDGGQAAATSRRRPHAWVVRSATAGWSHWGPPLSQPGGWQAGLGLAVSAADDAHNGGKPGMGAGLVCGGVSRSLTWVAGGGAGCSTAKQDGPHLAGRCPACPDL